MQNTFQWLPNCHFNPLSANPIKWSNTLKHCLIVFDHFAGMALKELMSNERSAECLIYIQFRLKCPLVRAIERFCYSFYSLKITDKYVTSVVKDSSFWLISWNFIWNIDGIETFSDNQHLGKHDEFLSQEASVGLNQREKLLISATSH